MLKFVQGVEVSKGDITTLDVDAIVNAANCSLLGGGGVDGCIHAAAGIELLNECCTLGGCQTGDAKITKGYKLKAKYVIHAVGPVYSGKPQDAALLASCYTRSLDLALAHSCKTIAFPCISTGVYGYPIPEAAEVSYSAVNAWFAQHPDYEIKVIFCCYTDASYQEYGKLLDNLITPLL